MYKITGIKYDNENNNLILGYLLESNNKSELLSNNFVYWLVKAGLVDNASAREDGDKLIVDVGTAKIPRILSSDFQNKTEKIYEAIRELSHNCLFNLNMEKCNVKIVGNIYTYRLDEISIHSRSSMGEIKIPVDELINIVAYEVKNTGTSLIYYETFNINNKEKELNVLNPGETVVLSAYETKILLAQLNVKCSNAYLTFDTDGPDLEPTVFDVNDDVLLKTTHEIERKVSFNTCNTSVLNRIINTEELWKQWEFIRS